MAEETAPALPGTTRDALLSGWCGTAPSRAQLWAPPSATAVAEHLAELGARGVIARGLGRSYGDAAQNAGGVVIDGTALDGIHAIDLEAGTVTCDAGVSLATLMQVLIPLGWFPTVIPGTRFVTVGGAIASDIHGKFRGGSFGDFVERAHLVAPGAGTIEIAPDGPDPDAYWATTGGMGLTGVVTDATLRLHPVETAWMSVDTERCADVDACMARMSDSDDRYRYSVAWIDCLATGGSLGRSVLERGNHATLDALDSKHRDRARDYAPRVSISAPPWLPNGLVNRLSMRAFNELWFRKAPQQSHDAIHSIVSFFHPLDMVLGWNRIYGSRGFLQYQFVVPDGAEHVVRAALEALSGAGTASFLAVLKRFESRNEGMLSFPMPGWTLAVDVPAGGASLAGLLDGLDRLVVEAGGRVYLAKDSRVDPAHLPAMYPDLGRFREVATRLDPRGTMQSDLDRRLGLRGCQGSPNPMHDTR